MKLIYKGQKMYISEAVAKANEILQSEEFYQSIQQLPPFDNTKLTPVEIATLIQKADQEVNITEYWSWNPFKPRTCVNASTVNSVWIKVNKRCFSKNLKSAVNTLIHESVHAVDYLNSEWDFTHEDNQNSGEENNTAPWAIGKLAESFV